MSASCLICGVMLPEGLGDYRRAICERCDERSLSSADETPLTASAEDAGNNPVFVDGQKCWRPYCFGGWVTMRDPWSCESLEELYKRQGKDSGV